MEHTLISVIVPVYNEERYLDACVASMLRQDYPREAMEWFFVDGMSTDRTVELLEAYQKQYPQLIQILHNEHRTVPYAMNLAIRQAKGRYIIRLDAHAEYADDYFSACVRVLDETGADNVGGVMETKAQTPMGRVIAKMLSSRFGVGNSQFRTNGKDGYVDTVPFGAFRREAFEAVGLYDERLTRNQDSELNYRILHHGGKIYLSHQIQLAYYCRDSVKGIVKMALLNGKWNIITMKLCPGSMRPRHFVPCLFDLSILGLGLLGLLWRPFWWLLGLELMCYLCLDAVASVRAGGTLGERLLLAFLFPAFHLSYGFGSIQGVAAVLGGQYSQ